MKSFTDVLMLFKTEMMEYLNFKGKMSQLDFVYFNIMVVIVTFVLGFVAGFIGLGIIAAVVIQLAFIIPVLSSQIRRFRDIGMSPWWCLLHIVVIGVIPMGSIIIMVMCGTIPTQSYGMSKDSNFE